MQSLLSADPGRMFHKKGSRHTPLHVVGSRAGEMLDKEAESSRRVLANMRDGATWLRLVKLAKWSTGNWDRAQDLVMDTFMRIMDPDDLPWTGTVPFLTFMMWSFRKVRYEQRRLARAREIAVPTDRLDAREEFDSPGQSDGEEGDENNGPGEAPRRTDIQHPLPLADAIIDAERERRLNEQRSDALMAALEAEDAKAKPDSLSLVGVCLEWMDDVPPREQAERLGCAVEKVYDAHEKIKRIARGIRDQQEAAEAQRMHVLRIQAQARQGVRS